MSFHPYTYTRTQQFRPPLWAAIMFRFKTNEPIKAIYHQKLANQLMLNGTLVIEIISNSFSESKERSN